MRFMILVQDSVLVRLECTWLRLLPQSGGRAYIKHQVGDEGFGYRKVIHDCLEGAAIMGVGGNKSPKV